MPKYMIYILISCGVILLLILSFVIRKKLKRKKKTEADRIKKKIALLNKNKKESPKEPAPKNPNEELLQFEEYTPPAEEKSNATPIYSDYIEEVQNDNKVAEEENKSRPISYEELLRRRADRQAERNAQNQQNPAIFDDFDDFDNFQAKHSSYIRYQTDPMLIQQIMDLPPELRAVVFGNLFSKINHDKL